MLTLKNVIAGNTYYAEYSTNLGDYAIINCDKDCNLTTSLGGIQISKKEYWKSNGWSCKNNIRLATDEEKAWLQHCIKEDKFVEYEEFMKVHKPQFIVGQWYKTKKYYVKCIKHINGKMTCSNLIRNDKFLDFKNSYYTFESDIPSGYKWELLTDLSEIQEFLPLDHPDKQLDIKQIQEECKRRFPIGCKFKNAKLNSQEIFTLNLRNDTYRILDNKNIDGGFFQGFLYYEGKYAELIETPEEETIVEYVECIKGSGSDFYYIIGNICKVESYNKKEKLLKLEGCKNTIRNIDLDKPFSSNNTNYKKSSKKAYDLQNLKQQPLTPKECYNTEIKVGDYIQFEDQEFYTVESNNPVHLFHHKDGKSYYYCKDLNHLNSLRRFKKANKNTTTTLNKKVDVSSPKVTDKITVPRINTTSYDTLVHINIETNTKSIKIPKLETNTPEIKKIKIQSLTLTI